MPTVTTVLVAVVNLIFVADLLRTKLASSPSTSTTTTTISFPFSSSSSSSPSSSFPSSSFDPLMDGAPGHGLRDVLRSTAAITGTATDGATILSGDVSDDEELTLGSGSGLYLPALKTETSPNTQLTHTLKNDRRSWSHSTCCFIGKLAASRQLHCVAQYHVDKLHMRKGPPEAAQQNRRGRTRAQLKSKLPHIRTRDFRRCVLQRPLVFQKCCYGYATTRSDRLRWYNHRKTRTGSLQNSYHSWRYIYS